jgi:hypothetical protein
MATPRKERPPTASEQLEALLGYPWPFRGQPPKHDLSTWMVTDDWPEHGHPGRRFGYEAGAIRSLQFCTEMARQGNQKRELFIVENQASAD